MNGYFKNLSDLLPTQLEGRKRNKIEILIHASKYIKELQSRSDYLLKCKESDVYSKYMHYELIYFSINWIIFIY